MLGATKDEKCRLGSDYKTLEDYVSEFLLSEFSMSIGHEKERLRANRWHTQCSDVALSNSTLIFVIL